MAKWMRVGWSPASSQQRGQSLALNLFYHLENVYQACLPEDKTRLISSCSLAYHRHPAFSFSRQEDSDGGTVQVCRNRTQLLPSPFRGFCPHRCRREPGQPALPLL